MTKQEREKAKYEDLGNETRTALENALDELDRRDELENKIIGFLGYHLQSGTFGNVSEGAAELIREVRKVVE